MKFLIFFLSSIFLAALNTFAIDEYDHEFKGCPLNSTCNKELGELREKSINLIKKNDLKALNELLSNRGILTAVWLRPKAVSSDSISWDSPCAIHQKDKKFQLALLPLKNFQVQKSKEFELLDFHFLYLKEGEKFNKYFIPRSAQPIYLDNENFYLLKFFYSKFYLHVD